MFKLYPVRIHQWTLGYYVMVFNATVNNIAVLYRGSQFYWWRKSEYHLIEPIMYMNIHLMALFITLM
jgi:hypothetical protein